MGRHKKGYQPIPPRPVVGELPALELPETPGPPPEPLPVLGAVKREQVQVIAGALQANLVLDTLRRMLDAPAAERIARATIESATLPGKQGHADRRLIFELMETDEDRRALLMGKRRRVELVLSLEDRPRQAYEGEVREIRE